MIDQSRRGNSAVVGLLDAPVNADLWRPAGADRWKAWDGFLESNTATGFMQSSWWSDFRATTGWQSFRVVLKHEGTIVGGATVMKFDYTADDCFYYIPEGPVLPPTESGAAHQGSASERLPPRPGPWGIPSGRRGRGS